MLDLGRAENEKSNNKNVMNEDLPVVITKSIVLDNTFSSKKKLEHLLNLKKDLIKDDIPIPQILLDMI